MDYEFVAKEFYPLAQKILNETQSLLSISDGTLIPEQTDAINQIHGYALNLVSHTFDGKTHYERLNEKLRASGSPTIDLEDHLS